MSAEVFIIPGFKQSPSKYEFQKIGKMFEGKSIKPIYIEIPWNNSTITDNVKFFLEKYHQSRADKKYILGFSFGAVISLLSASMVRFDTVILCSLSPYFPEDLPNLKKSWIKSIGTKRLCDFKSFDTLNIISSVNSSVFLLYGTKEGEEIEKRAFDVFNQLNCIKEIVKINGSKHDIGDTNYLKEIKTVIEKLK